MASLELPPPISPASSPKYALWRWLGPLGRYRPGLLRRDLARGFKNCDVLSLPHWARLPLFVSPEERLLLGLSLHGQVVYDIGAHTGAYALFFSRQVGAEGRVVAFEPHPRNFGILSRNLACNGIRNVRAVPTAVGGSAGTRLLYALPGMSTTASLAPEASTPLRRRAGSARIERLDRLIAKLALPAPDFIKIDVEGMEFEVLRGAVATLARHRPALLIEVHGTGRARKAERSRQMAEFLSQWNYRLLHAESGATVTAGSMGLGSGHLYARVA